MTANPPRCPVCAKPTDPAHAPFCSRGCRDRDLITWLSDGYRLPERGGVDSAEDAD